MNVLNWLFDVFFLYKHDADVVGLTGLKEKNKSVVNSVKRSRKKAEPKLSDLIRGCD